MQRSAAVAATVTTGSSSSSLAINLERLRHNMVTLSAFSATDSPTPTTTESATTPAWPPKSGVTRLSFSKEDMAARRWLIDTWLEPKWIKETAGIGAVEGYMDGVGNVFCRWVPQHLVPTSTNNNSNDNNTLPPSIMMGSHLDSVPSGGAFDGSLGVMAGIEVMTRLIELYKSGSFHPRCPIEVVATSEEEGRFGGMLGSQAMAGNVDPDWLKAAKDESGGETLVEAMQRNGLNPNAALSGECKRDPSSLKAFIELHIEQGPVLDAKKIPVGIVTGISGVCMWTVTITGKANHSGTTPMNLRKDAFLGLARFADSLQSIIDQFGNEDKNSSRLTIGKVDVVPNFPHTVPGEVRFTLCLRDTKEDVMHRLAKACRAKLEDNIAKELNLAINIDQTTWLAPQDCHPNIIQRLKTEAEIMKVDHLVMSSGAGHDTQNLALLCPSGMVFVPSLDGVSHSPLEKTEWADIELGCNVMLRAVARLAEEEDESGGEDTRRRSKL